MEVPLANPAASPVQISSDYYYRIPAQPIYKGYPVYHPAKEPPGYMDWLRRQKPQYAFDASQLKTQAHWVRAGEIVFNAPIDFDGRMFITLRDVRNAEWYRQLGIPLTRDGIMPFAQYVIRENGKVELGVGSCATCHLRVLADGTVIVGAQGNLPYDRVAAFALRRMAREVPDPEGFLEQVQRERRLALGVPWLEPDPLADIERMSIEQIASQHEAVPPGVAVRVNTSLAYPPQIPDLIGVKDIRYLNHTGLIRNRSIADLMRYAALVQGAVRFQQFLGFRALRTLPPPGTYGRYGDDQLYALALFLCSLKPPPNPYRLDKIATRGRTVFEREGCQACHTPPLYTNNKLTPVEGFMPPREHLAMFDILPVHVGTDPSSALRTREGTGYYKVPSLRGVWYRGPFEHNGSVATLEDWFDPRRLRDDYVPTGFRGYGVQARAVKGHTFGLALSPQDRKALIAFLKTL
jgi:hypothetical protein